MTKEELATQLNGRDCYSVITDNEEQAAKGAGLVVVFGDSSDGMVFRGAIDYELEAYGGRTALVTTEGLLEICEDGDDEEGCPHFLRAAANAVTIRQLWCAEGNYSWTYETDIPHATFEILDEILDPYCRGIVFALADVLKKEAVNA